MGMILRNTVIYEEGEERERALFIMYIGFLGELMMRSFKMIIIPLLMASIISGITNLGGTMSGVLAKRAFTYFMGTTVMAVVLGIVLVQTIRPGDMKLDGLKNATEPEKPFHPIPMTELQFMDLARSLVPKNIFLSTVAVEQTKAHPDYTKQGHIDRPFSTNPKLGSPNILGLVGLAIIIAGLMTKLGDKVRPIKVLVDAFSEIILLAVHYIMWAVPVGVMSLIAKCIYEMEGDIMNLVKSLGLYMATVMIGLLIHWFIILPAIYWFVVRKNPFSFMKGLSRSLVTAFGTASSACALPISMQCCEENLNIDKRISRFILPLGCTVNMNGTALMEGVAAVAISQMEGHELSMAQICSLSITATLASIGASSIPSAGLIMLTMILTSLGVSDRAIAYLWAIDWLLDRFRTVTNVWGDCVGCAIVQKWSQYELDSIPYVDDNMESSEDVFHSQKALVSKPKRHDGPHETGLAVNEAIRLA